MTHSHTPRDVVEVWNEIEESDPDISTERLAAMVAERLGLSVPTVLCLLRKAMKDEANR